MFVVRFYEVFPTPVVRGTDVVICLFNTDLLVACFCFVCIRFVLV